MSADQPVVRPAARVILVDRLDQVDRVLLVHGRDPARPDQPSWWITVGGGRDPGESDQDAARREVLEETGLRLGDLGDIVMTRVVEFEFEGEWYQQHEVFYLVRLEPDQALDTSGWNDLERRALSELRWWTLEELAGTDQTIYPEGLLELLRGNGIGPTS